MTERTCVVPIKIRLRGIPQSDHLAELRDTITQTVTDRLRAADRTIATREGWTSWTKRHSAPRVTFRGAALDDATRQTVRSEIEASIAHAIAGGRSLPTSGRSPFVLAQYRQQTGSARSAASTRQSKRVWHIQRSITFHISIDRMIDWIQGLSADTGEFVKRNRSLYFDQLGTVRTGTVYVVVADQPALVDWVANEMQQYLDAKYADQEYIYGYAIRREARQSLIERGEGSELHSLPEMRIDQVGVSLSNEFYLKTGGVLLYAVLPLPSVEIGALADIDDTIEFNPRVRDLDFIVNEDSFERLFRVSWKDYVDEFGDRPGLLRARLVVPTTAVHFNTLHYLVNQAVAAELDKDTAYFGNLYLLNQTTLNWLPPFARSRMDGVGEDATRKLEEPRRFGVWETGWVGAFIHALLPLNDLDRSAALHRPNARRLLPEMAQWLQRDPTEYDWGRGFLLFLSRNFGRNPPDTRPDDGTDFEFMLTELRSMRLFDTLFDRIEASKHVGAHQLVLRLTQPTIYATEPRVLRSQVQIGQDLLSRRENTYEFNPQAILLDHKVRVEIGEVLGDKWSLYIFERDDQRLRPSRLPAFREAMREAAFALMGKIARGEDKKIYGEEDFARAALDDALKRMNLKKDDFEDVTRQRSIRLVKLEARTVQSLPRIFVTFKIVERVKGEEWLDISGEVTEIEDDFEARLIYWALGRAGEFYEKMTIAISAVGLVAIAWEAGIVAALVEIAGGSTAVLMSIGTSVLTYLVRVAFFDEKLTLRGFLEAVLDGYLMALGFRGAFLLGRTAAEAIGTASLRRVVGGWIAERLIVGVVGGASTAAMTTFSHDLIAIATGEGGFSGIGTYVKNMALGAAFGLAMEFIGAPILNSLGRAGLQALKEAREIVKLLRAEGVTAAKLGRLMVDGLNSARQRLTPLIGDVAAEGFSRAMSEHLAELLEQMTTRSVARRVLELAKVALSSSASSGLEKLLTAGEFNPSRAQAFFDTLGKNPQQASVFLEVIDGLEASAVRRLIDGTFGGSAHDLAAFVRRLGNFSIEQQRQIMQLLDLLGVEAGPAPRTAPVRSELLVQQGKEIAQRAQDALRRGLLDEALFNELKRDLLDWLRRIKKLHDLLLSTGVMSKSEFDATRGLIDGYIERIEAATYQSGGRNLLLDANQISLEAVGGRLGRLSAPPAPRPPAATEAGSPGEFAPSGTPPALPGPPGTLALPPAEGPPPPQLTFLESAAGGALTAAERAQATRDIARINRLALAELEGRGDTGMAALSLLYRHRAALRAWRIDSVRGLATALELPRAITHSDLERFFQRPSAEIADMFEKFLAIADMPGANLVFRQSATRRTIILIDVYRLLKKFTLPPGMNESAQRGLLAMRANLGEQGLIDRFLQLRTADRRLAELIANDPLTTAPPVAPIAQQILDRHAGDISPGINLADPALTPAQVRMQIEAYAAARNASFDSHIPARIEATIAGYRGALQRVQNGIETDGRNVDGTREEFRALFLALDRGAEILSFSRKLGAGAGDPFEVLINVGWHPLRGRVTVINAPSDLKVQLDILSRTAQGFELEEVTFSHLGLPKPLEALADDSAAPVTADWNHLDDEIASHRKWQQVFKNIAVAEFGEQLTLAWGGVPARVRIVVRARSASAGAIKALAKLGVNLEMITP
jgi:hypothetical protein